MDCKRDCDNASVVSSIAYVNLCLMGKKQASSSSAAAKAAKKAKALKKTERKETKTALKSKPTTTKSSKKPANDSDTDDDDLEGILEKARIQPFDGIILHMVRSIDAERMGGSPYCD